MIECGMLNAECGMKVKGIRPGPTSHPAKAGNFWAYGILTLTLTLIPRRGGVPPMAAGWFVLIFIF
jgi:hypothetical protein